MLLKWFAYNKGPRDVRLMSDAHRVHINHSLMMVCDVDNTLAYCDKQAPLVKILHVIWFQSGGSTQSGALIVDFRASQQPIYCFYSRWICPLTLSLPVGFELGGEQTLTHRVR